MFESMMKWAVGLTAVGCVLAMAATVGADVEYSASRTVGDSLFPGGCPRVVVADDGTWLMLRRCTASGGGVTSHAGQVFLAHSDDDGETWIDDGKISNDTVDAINAEFIKYPNGDIDIFYQRYRNSTGTFYTPNMVNRLTYEGTYEGSTWSGFHEVPSGPLREPTTTTWQDVSVGNTTYLTRSGPTFSKTTDNGNSWTDVSSITTPEEGSYNEPGLAYLGKTDLGEDEFLVVLRDGNKGHTLQKRSIDGGQTWTVDGYIKSDGSVDALNVEGKTNVRLHQCRMWTEDIDGNDLGYIYMQANLYEGYPRDMYAYFSTDGGASWGFRSLIEANAHDSALVLKSRSSAKYYPGRMRSEGNITCDDIDIVTPPLIPGDANLDNVVNDEDASILAAHWQQSGEGIDWSDGDFNDDGVVDDKDAAILAAHWLETAEGAPVPEPGALVLLAGALLSLLIWRRH